MSLLNCDWLHGLDLVYLNYRMVAENVRKNFLEITTNHCHIYRMTTEGYQAQEEHSPEALESCTPKNNDNNHNHQNEPIENTRPANAFKQLALLDRFLALWIFLAMAVGIILGNFVPDTDRVLQRGEFVGVSIPIGVFAFFYGQLGLRGSHLNITDG